MGKKLVVDSSVLIILSRREDLEAYLTRRKGEGYEVLIPRAIMRERRTQEIRRGNQGKISRVGDQDNAID